MPRPECCGSSLGLVPSQSSAKKQCSPENVFLLCFTLFYFVLLYFHYLACQLKSYNFVCLLPSHAQSFVPFEPAFRSFRFNSPFDAAFRSHKRPSRPSSLLFWAFMSFDPAFQFCLLVMQEAARRAHERLAAEENRELMMAKAQRHQEEEQYAKDVTRIEQQTEVHTATVVLQNISCPLWNTKGRCVTK